MKGAYVVKKGVNVANLVKKKGTYVTKDMYIKDISTNCHYL